MVTPPKAENVDQGVAALLVIDMQKGLFERAQPIYNADRLLETLNLLLRAARAVGAPVFFIQHANTGMLAEGSDGWQLHPQVQPLAHEAIVHKRHGNAFEATDLHDRLTKAGVRKVVVTGLVTNGCVRATCEGALALGYDVVLVADGHSSYVKDAAALVETWNEKLRASGVDVRPAEQTDFGAGR